MSEVSFISESFELDCAMTKFTDALSSVEASIILPFLSRVRCSKLMWGRQKV